MSNVIEVNFKKEEKKEIKLQNEKKEEISTEAIFRHAGKFFEKAFVVGFDKDGKLWAVHNLQDTKQVLYLLRQVERSIELGKF